MRAMRNVNVRSTRGGKNPAQMATQCSFTIGSSSRGGPGSRNNSLPPVSMTCPGAVPCEFGSTRAPSRIKAWRRLRSVIARLNLRKRAAMPSNTSASNCSSRPRARAAPSRVRSSSVGPSPPETITSSARARHCWMASAISSRVSPTTRLPVTAIPR